MAEFCKIPDKCPAAKDCVKLNYRGSNCAALRAAYDADYDPDDDACVCIVYYKNDAGEIVSAQFAPEGKTYSELIAMCDEYNASVKNLQEKKMRNEGGNMKFLLQSDKNGHLASEPNTVRELLDAENAWYNANEHSYSCINGIPAGLALQKRFPSAPSNSVTPAPRRSGQGGFLR